MAQIEIMYYIHNYYLCYKISINVYKCDRKNTSVKIMLSNQSITHNTLEFIHSLYLYMIKNCSFFIALFISIFFVIYVK